MSVRAHKFKFRAMGSKFVLGEAENPVNDDNNVKSGGIFENLWF